MLRLKHAYASLPERFYARVEPTPVKDPAWLKFNIGLADQLGLDAAALQSPAGLAIFAGNAVPKGAKSVAMAYAGHQFGHFVPQLGDGRALLLGEVQDAKGVLWDIMLKGSGRTPFSRRGDGRAALGPVIREYLVSEAMHALGVPTTRALAVVTTGESVVREDVQPGAVLTRVAQSHVRVGTFEYFAARGDHEALRTLADYVIKRHAPHCLEVENPYQAWLAWVCEQQAALIAQWMALGFVHGVMNTDNMSIIGHTIDYGPCAWMDAYDPSAVWSAIDEYGRYAYNQQPGIAQWNLACLAQAVLPLLNADNAKAIEIAQALIEAWPARFATHRLQVMRAKLGLTQEQPNDAQLITGFLDLLHKANADYTNSFRELGDSLVLSAQESSLAKTQLPGYEAWSQAWLTRLQAEPLDAKNRQRQMHAVNPAYIARNHRVQQVIQAAVQDQNFEPLHELSAVLANPYAEQPKHRHYRQPPKAHEQVQQTFCGT